MRILPRKRSRAVSLESAITRFDAYGGLLEIEVQVRGTLRPYWPGDRNNPPEGGEVEDVEAVVWDETARVDRHFTLTKEEEEYFTDTLKSAVEKMTHINEVIFAVLVAAKVHNKHKDGGGSSEIEMRLRLLEMMQKLQKEK